MEAQKKRKKKFHKVVFFHYEFWWAQKLLLKRIDSFSQLHLKREKVCFCECQMIDKRKRNRQWNFLNFLFTSRFFAPFWHFFSSCLRLMAYWKQMDRFQLSLFISISSKEKWKFIKRVLTFFWNNFDAEFFFCFLFYLCKDSLTLRIHWVEEKSR